jgi:hypothetical protein
MTAFVSETFDGKAYISEVITKESVKEYISGLTQDEYLLCIRLAVEALQSMKTSAQRLEYKEAFVLEVKKGIEKAVVDKEKGIRDAEQKYTRQVSDLELQVEKLKASLQVSDHTSQKLREELASAQARFSSALLEIGKQKEAQYEKEIDRLSATHRTMLENLERGAKERVEGMRQVYQEQEEKLRKQYERVLGSTEKGKQGEREFDELVAQYTNWGTLTNTAKTAHSTDRTGKIRQCDARFEIKNYSGDIPSQEVAKFERDMEENGDCPLGVFISLKTGIAGKKGDGFLTMKWTSKSQMLLYINNFYNHVVEDVLKFIDLCADTAYMVYKAARDIPEQSELTLLLQTRIDQAKVYIEQEVKRMDGFATCLAHDKQFLLETITRQYAKYTYNVEQSGAALRSLLDILLGTPQQVKEGTMEEVPIQQKATKARGKKKQQKLDGEMQDT